MNAYFFNVTKEERENILDKHKSVYDGYVTNYVQPNQQPLYTQDFANDKDGMTVSNKGVIKPYTNMNINEDIYSGSHGFEPELSFEDTDEHLDMIGDGDDDLLHGTTESEIEELFDTPELRDKFGVDYEYNPKDFAKKINMPRVKLDLDKIDRKADIEEPKDKPDFSDTDFEFVDEDENLEESQKENVKKQISESLDMFRRFNKY